MWLFKCAVNESHLSGNANKPFAKIYSVLSPVQVMVFNAWLNATLTGVTHEVTALLSLFQA
ncbi:MAG: hypothetical protein IPP48_00955 [Chitinophagaceae bacterium]|nr:hypothetical protein [Chitinophagaceae bacterium]